MSAAETRLREAYKQLDAHKERKRPISEILGVSRPSARPKIESSCSSKSRRAEGSYLKSSDPWKSVDASEPLALPLDHFHEPNDVLRLTLRMPHDSVRFALNIGNQPDTQLRPTTTWFYHFSPRHWQSRFTVAQDTFVDLEWRGRGKKDGLATFPFSKGSMFEFELRFSKTSDAIQVFVDGERVSIFKHELGSMRDAGELFLVFPIIETTYGDVENVEVFEAWWGRYLDDDDES